MPTDWLLWLDYLDRHEGGEGTRRIAQQGSAEWDPASLVERPEELARFAARLFDGRPRHVEHVLHDCLPYLLAFFRKDSRCPNRACAGVYRALLELIVFSTCGGGDDLTLFNELLEALLRLGMEEKAYRELTDFARSVRGLYGSPMLLDWLCDLLEVLLLHPCPAPAARQEVFLVFCKPASCTSGASKSNSAACYGNWLR